MKKILVTGSGGIGGVNFVRALRAIKGEFFIIGTDFNQFHLEFPSLDIRVKSPKHSDPEFIKLLVKLIKDYNIDFLHPHPSSEAHVVSRERHSITTKIYLPPENVISRDKLETQKLLRQNNVPVPETRTLKSINDIDKQFHSIGEDPHWVRAKSGAGGNLSLLCNNSEEVMHWIELWIRKKRAVIEDFMIQEYLPGRNLAWDSLWYDGKLIASFTRERLEYPFKHISPSGITGTPTVTRIIKDEKVNKIAEKGIRSIDNKPHGNYAVDLKEDGTKNFRITEIDAGKFHTTTPLWGYISSKILKLEPFKNLPYLYCLLGMGDISEPEILGFDIYPEGLYLLRHIDCGAWLWREDGFKEMVL